MIVGTKHTQQDYKCGDDTYETQIGYSVTSEIESFRHQKEKSVAKKVNETAVVITARLVKLIRRLQCKECAMLYVK